MSSPLAHNVQVRVLVVEDHVALADRIGEGLRDAGFAVDVVYDGAAALQSTASTGYDVVVLDRDLPAVHGDRVCRRLVRDGSPSRILMLTAAADVEDRVDGLELGADDYLGKPFAFSELIARIRALGRRGRRCGQRRGAARTRVGRPRRPVQQHGRGDHQAVAAQARLPAADRDRHRRRLPAVSSHLSARSRLTLLYASLFTLGGAALALITYLLVAHTLHPTTATTIPPAAQQAIARCVTAVQTGRAAAGAMTKCAAIYANGVQAGASAQRATTLTHLLTYSLLSLAGVTLLAAAAGWIAAG